MPKRKRAYQSGYSELGAYRSRKRRKTSRGIRGAQRGYVRTGGYYGRYSGLAGNRAEKKFHDLDFDDAVIAAGMNVSTAMLTIPEGNGEQERIGRAITITNIGIKYDISLPSTPSAANTRDVVRFMVVQDKQCNGALPAALDLLETADYQSFNNLANSRRFRVLMDRNYSLTCKAGSGRGATDTLSYGFDSVQDTFYKKCNIQIEYDNSATDGTIGTIRSNNIFLVVGTRQGLATFASKIRFRFTDR